MKVTTGQVDGISVVRVDEPRLTFAILPELSSAVRALTDAGRHELVIDLTPVAYLDSATIGFLMELYRRVTVAGGRLKLSVQKRVETMLTLTGAQKFIELHCDAPTALQTFR
jgi:anti-anti-sigma factor